MLNVVSGFYAASWPVSSASSDSLKVATASFSVTAMSPREAADATTSSTCELSSSVAAEVSCTEAPVCAVIAEIEPIAACQHVLKRVCDAVALILETAEQLSAPQLAECQGGAA